MASIDPLDVSPYLTMARRDLRTACLALIRHADNRAPCGACPVSDICVKSSIRVDRVSRRNSPDTLPKAALNLPCETEARSTPMGVAV